MSDSNSSSLKAYADSAVGAGQSLLGKVTGSTGDKANAQATKSKAEAEKEESHSVGKVGPMAFSSSGGVHADDPNRSEGSWNQTVGSGKETVGNLLGAEGLKKEGQQQNAEGKGQEAQGQLSDFGKGVGDRVQGTVGGMVSGITGDRENQEKYRNMHDDGKTAQRSAEADIQKQS
ncbi:hypothetical protein G7Y79_00001g000530 [Physcia stellaris]|nr:hypothetical protein G7Y79_00001g000530 [Physcia stellaris]